MKIDILLMLAAMGLWAVGCYAGYTVEAWLLLIAFFVVMGLADALDEVAAAA